MSRPLPRVPFTIAQVIDPPGRPAAFEQFLASLSGDSVLADHPAEPAAPVDQHADPVDQHADPVDQHADPVDQHAVPAGQLPTWLQQVVIALFHGQDVEVADRWAWRLFQELDRSGWQLPFEVVHDWLARTVVPMASAGSSATAGLRELHTRAAAGQRFGQADWLAVLEPVLYELYRDAYDYATAYATARASASAYARANNFSADGAVRFADSYAADSTEANRRSYAESNAVATAGMLAAAYAGSDARAYAEAYPFALLHACAHASANRAEPATDHAEGPAADRDADRAARRRAAYAHLADGLADSHARLG